MTFMYVSGRPCLDFSGTLRFRGSAEADELLTAPRLLSDWAIQAGLVDTAIEMTQHDLEMATALREAVYRVVIARLSPLGHRSSAPDRIEVGDLATTVDTLRKAGAHFRNDIVSGVGGKQIIVDDPSGNPVELFEPTLPEARLGSR